MSRIRKLTLSDEQRQELVEHRDHDPRPDVRERCAAMLKIAEGQVARQVAQRGLLKPRDSDTVYSWLDRYQAEGLKGLIAHRHGGPRARGVFGSAGELSGRDVELEERLRQAPGEEARAEVMPGPEAPPPSRWTLRTIRASVWWLHDYTLSGVWRVLHRNGLSLRSGQVQQFSPDPEYGSKVAYLLTCLQETALHPDDVAFLFMDEMGYRRWPAPAPHWMLAAPHPVSRAPCAGNDQHWRVIGVLNALTGQVDYLDNYIVGRQKVIEMYQLIDTRYADKKHIYVGQDNWSIHRHDDVMTALAGLPRIEPVWLPTYAPWLNPIEKLWRWCRQDVLKLHRLAADWEILKHNVNAFLGQFAQGSQELLRYVGLLGDGKLAEALRVT